MKLTNKRFLFKQHFELKHSSLNVKKQSIFDSAEFEILYENIFNKKKTQVAINNNLVFLAFFSGLIGVFLFFLGWNFGVWIRPILFGLTFFIIALYTKKRTITIATFDGNDIELFFNQNNKADVDEFAERIIKSSNKFLLNKYGKVDKAVPAEIQLQNLIFLRDREIITENEFEDLKMQLFGKSAMGYQ